MAAMIGRKFSAMMKTSKANMPKAGKVRVTLHLHVRRKYLNVKILCGISIEGCALSNTFEGKYDRPR
jgi:hypothetical protein